MGDEGQTQTGYFGGCPHCRTDDGCFNIESTHFLVCDRHRVKWCIGSNLFSSWRDETEDDWQKNFERFADYREVEPYRDPVYEGSTEVRTIQVVHHAD